MKSLIIATFALLSSTAFSHSLPEQSKWASDYIPGKGSYKLYVNDETTVTVLEDKNICGFNYLGNVSFCTLMAPIPTQGILKVKAVPTDRMTLLYTLENSKFQIVHNLGEQNQGFIHLLKVNESGNVVDSVKLFSK